MSDKRLKVNVDINKDSMKKVFTGRGFVVLFLIVCLMLISAGAFQILNAFNYSPKVDQAKAHIELDLDNDTLNAIKDKKYLGTPIDPGEGGLGRPNPFASY